MNPFRRLSATMFARVDEAVRGIENHDAVVGVSLDDLRRALAETRVRERRIQAGLGQRTRQRDGLAGEATQWRERARAAGDEATGIACLRRARDCDRRIEALDREIDSQQQARDKVAQAVARLEQRHRELADQRQTLRGREAAARAQRVAERASVDDGESLQDTLERWEIDITTDELAVPEEPGDALARGFEAAEEEASLQAELAGLRGNDAGGAK